MIIQLKKIPYKISDYEIKKGVTYVKSFEGKIKLNFFGKHNLINLEGARLLCQYMGVNETDFFESIYSFNGVSGRLELLASGKTSFLYKDFAHAPSKVKATKDAVLEQFKGYRIVVCLELHTYSSLDLTFLKNYSDTLNGIDKIIVFYSLDVLKAKNRDIISSFQIKESFNNQNIELITNLSNFKRNLYNDDYYNTLVLMMSSGNFDGFNYKSFVNYIESF